MFALLVFIPVAVALLIYGLWQVMSLTVEWQVVRRDHLDSGTKQA
jgi:hypothetical protein